MTYLVISHDLVTVACLSSTVAVMYPGRIVEIGPTKAVYETPRHPYTLLLQQSAPDLEGNFLKVKQPQVLAPRAEGVWRAEEGCRYASRCALRLHLGEPDRCRTEEPVLRPVAPGHAVACHFSEQTRRARRGGDGPGGRPRQPQGAPAARSRLERREDGGPGPAGRRLSARDAARGTRIRNRKWRSRGGCPRLRVMRLSAVRPEVALGRDRLDVVDVAFAGQVVPDADLRARGH